MKKATMNKIELISTPLQQKADLTQKDATKAVNVVFETIFMNLPRKKNPTNWLWYI